MIVENIESDKIEGGLSPMEDFRDNTLFNLYELFTLYNDMDSIDNRKDNIIEK